MITSKDISRQGIRANENSPVSFAFGPTGEFILLLPFANIVILKSGNDYLS